MQKARIDADVVTCLLREQVPHLAHLPVTPMPVDGWDNSSFRIGGEHTARLPSADGYVAAVAKEHRWLPVLAPHLPVPIPEPVVLGAPGCGFPRPWSVYRWLPGTSAGDPSIHVFRTGRSSTSRSPRKVIAPTSSSGFGSIHAGTNPRPV